MLLLLFLTVTWQVVDVPRVGFSQVDEERAVGLPLERTVSTGLAEVGGAALTR